MKEIFINSQNIKKESLNSDILNGMKDQLVSIYEKAMAEDVPIMKDDGLAFLLDYIREHEQIRDILECGTAVGYSAIRMAEIRWDMTVDTIEIDESMYRQACENVKTAGYDDRIHCHLCDAAVFDTNRIYDLIFIDAAKSQYRRYLEHYIPNSAPGTVFVFDNLAFHGIVDNNELSHNRSTVQMVHKILKFREHLLSDERFDTVYYPDVGDGVAIAVRK